MSEVPKAKNDLQLEQDLRYQRRSWRVERIGWVVMLLMVVAALLGLTGKGGLAVNRMTEGSLQQGLYVEYNKYWRSQAPEYVGIALPAASPLTELRISKGYFEKIYLNSILPEPEKIIQTETEMVLYFGAEKGTPDIEVQLILEPHKTGDALGTISANGQSHTLSHFIYP